MVAKLLQIKLVVAPRLQGARLSSPLPRLLFVLAVALGLYFLNLRYGVQVGIWQDDAAYLVLSESIATGQPFRQVNDPGAPLELVYPPGYPLLLSPLWRLTGGNLELLRGASLTLAMINVVLLYFLLRRDLSGTPLWITLALFSWSPAVAEFAVTLMSETTYLFFSLCFLLAVSHRGAQPCVTTKRLLLAALFLAAATLVRYQGIALIGSALLWLSWHGRSRSAVILVAAVLTLCAPFVVFLYLNGVNSPASMTFVSDFFASQVPALMQDARVPLVNYSYAIPYSVFPLFGPSVITYLDGVGVWWIPPLVNGLLMLMIGIGLMRLLRGKELAALYLLLYAVVAGIVAQRDQGPAMHDEMRYLVVVSPFLITCLVLGLLALALRYSVYRSPRLRLLAVFVLALLLAAPLWRTVRTIESRRDFLPIDLLAGADWVKSHIQSGDSIMVTNPQPRYLYLRRKTVEFPLTGDCEFFLSRVRHARVNYVMVVPPLTIGYDPNRKMEITPSEAVALEAMERLPDQFTLMYVDGPQRLWVFKVGTVDERNGDTRC